MKQVGLVGWRGMVGSVLMQRMVEENDFAHIDPVYFSTSNAGGKAPAFGRSQGTAAPLNASNIDALKKRHRHHLPGRRLHQRKYSPSCVLPAGTATGSTPPRRCAWPMTP